jgi:DNA-binding response OmpR family regulator
MAKINEDLMRIQNIILVVEYDESLAGEIRSLLEGEGHVVVCCHNSLDVVDIAKEQTFDVILIDYHMPYMKGDMVCRLLRHFQRDAFIIGCCSQQLGKVFINAGADAFVAKGHLVKDLALLIRSHAARRLEGGI